MASSSAAITLILAVCCPAVVAANVTGMDSQSLTRDGIAAYNRGDYALAIRLLVQRSGMPPEDATVFYYLGNCYVRTRQNDRAVRMYSTCIRKAPVSQAAKYALTALEGLSAAPGAATDPPAPSPAAIEAARESLSSTAPVDKTFNDAVRDIKSQRASLKARVDGVFQKMQDDLQALSPRSATYAVDMEKVRREADNTTLDLQTRELRKENRLLGPDKIDARAIPQLPQERTDDTKAPLGSLLDYFKPDKPFDPLAADLTPEITAKFMSAKDVFGELSTYQPQARRVARQVFRQLKSGIEGKQDLLDEQLFQVRANLIDDIASLLAGDTSGSQLYKRLTPGFYASSSSIPRADPSNLSPTDQEISRRVEVAKKRIKELEDSYYRDVDSLIAGARERVSAMVTQAGQMASQLKHAAGNIQLVPLGTDVYVRNYVNFGDRAAPPASR